MELSRASFFIFRSLISLLYLESAQIVGKGGRDRHYLEDTQGTGGTLCSACPKERVNSVLRRKKFQKGKMLKKIEK